MCEVLLSVDGRRLPPVRDKKVFQQENGPQSPPAATIPAKFLCPINRSLMLEPMYSAETELTYEHQAIVHVVQDGAGVCPVTQRSVDLHKLVLNTKLQHEIRAFQTRQAEDDAVLAP
ncbi:hypothetical protein SPRG_18134 [Saprolegnia parasitica CBS 223.65]|uniref:U-box domain-containing protein n=1 Tax=Saprolegnia parasitica (strain CBS 223.65) TaxID=695850 RepID=A0A067BNR5_SAPPC|nr:hypothetical protein SPRG_18134 [Saprolegnia parasitica CBS 223.65]KDO16337.1 hypothetical protein SPRG_18134 [Saprolegnia parasitica CBS 223.65]|eukprot:XP_012212957.1 hypothetical protein SPRG_18134 [Saprolegnia parasitica CBS 223.65]